MQFIIKNKLIITISIVIITILIIIYFTSQDNDVIEVNEVVEKTEENIKLDLIKVYVTGEINQPKIVEVEKGIILNEIIKLCGGLTENASKNINLVYEINKNVTLVIEEKNSINGIDIIDDIGDVVEIDEESGFIDGQVNINIATYENFCLLPGIGESTANAIIEYRNSNGPFKTIDEIMNVPGIKVAKFNSIKKLITIN